MTDMLKIAGHVFWNIESAVEPGIAAVKFMPSAAEFTHNVFM
jgi:hypothetical protein